jgi:predicted HAD superfamily Cof-like phosphohydrolase
MLFRLVAKQQEHFGIRYHGKPRYLSNKEKLFYYNAFNEEAEEYFQAMTIADEYDALIDLLIFASGALLRHGFSPAGIEEVVNANMKKQLGPIKNKREEFELDLVKPEGWQAPDLSRYL